MAEPVGILTLLLDAVKLVAKPIKRQFNYLCCLNNNVQSLQEQTDMLKGRREVLQERVDSSQNNGQQIYDHVIKWLNEADVILKIGGEIKEGSNNVQSGCLGIKSRYELSRKAVKMAEKAKQHQDDENKFDSIAHPLPIPAQQTDPPVQAMEFQSRKEIEENVMKVLREQKSGVIGICGMGGLGKTTMAKKLRERAKKENLFDETLMVVAGQDANALNIQRDIAAWLKLDLDDGPIAIRANALRRRLSCGKRIFIIMDDIWNQPKFEDLGIPCEACTILLTSRSSDVFKNKDVKVFTMQFLNDKEALDLFIEKSQIDRDDGNLIQIAQKFVRECKGLPLTLAVIGSLLNDEKDVYVWNDTLDQLTNFRVEKIDRFDEEVYRPLKFSFTKLDNVDAKRLLLLFSQFPEDSEIHPNDLALFCMSLHLFGEEISKVEQTKYRVRTVVKKLKNRSLLLDGSDNKNFVKIHDLVRDIANMIAKEEQQIDDKSGSHFVGHCKWISEKSRKHVVNIMTFRSGLVSCTLIVWNHH